MIKDEDPYENLKNKTWKELRDMVEDLEWNLSSKEIEAQKVPLLEAMIAYIASNYAIFVMASDPDNKGGEKEMLDLRDNIIKQAHDYVHKDKTDPA